MVSWTEVALPLFVLSEISVSVYLCGLFDLMVWLDMCACNVNGDTTDHKALFNDQQTERVSYVYLLIKSLAALKGIWPLRGFAYIVQNIVI